MNKERLITSFLMACILSAWIVAGLMALLIVLYLVACLGYNPMIIFYIMFLILWIFEYLRLIWEQREH